MKRFHTDDQGHEHEERLDDVTAPPPLPAGGGGGPRPRSGEGPNDSFMETWDVLQAPRPVHGKPLPDEDEDERWGGS
jgi:hypothetical protein